MTRGLTRFLTLSLIALLALAAAGPAGSDDTSPATMIVLDGSGSMWAKAEGSTIAKIDIVRDKLVTIVDGAHGRRIGLAAFGHRRRRDCTDTQLFSRPVADKQIVRETIQSLNPQGKGPLVSAFEIANAAIDGNAPSNIVIIGDGADNCKQDACAAASAFAERMPGVPVHMVAIGVGPIHKARLECVPQATGGRYIEARTDEEIIAALNEVAGVAGLTGAIAKQPETATPKITAPPVVSDGAAVKAYVVLKEGGEALPVPVRWTIRDQTSKSVLAEMEGPTITAELKPGDVIIEAETADFRVATRQSLKKGEAISLAVPLNAARIRATTRPTPRNPISQTALISVEPDRSKDEGTPQQLGSARISHGGELDALLMPGDYRVTTVEGPIRTSKQVTLEPGASEKIDFVLDSGNLELSARSRSGGPLLDDITFVIATDDPDQPNGRREVARSRAASPVFPLPAGTYYIEARTGWTAVSRQVAVSAGETTRLSVLVPLVPVSLSALIADEPANQSHGVSFRLSSLDDNDTEIGRFLTPTASLNLIPGRYRAEARLAADHISAETSFTVEAGQPLDVTITIPAARLKLSLADGPTLVSDTFWEIADANGEPVWRNTEPTPTAIVSPGRYTVTFESRTRRLKADIEVASGDEKAIVLGQAAATTP